MHRKSAENSESGVEVLDHSQLMALAERTAQQVLGLSFEDALKRVDAGELSGTIIESELKMFRHLISC